MLNSARANGTRALIARVVGWRDWLQAARHITIILGFALIALAWGAAEFDLRRAAQINESATLTIQLAISDAAGRLLASSTDPLAAPIDISDREHFRVHAGAESDTLFISKPVLGRASGQWSVQLTRGYRDREGRFAGVMMSPK